MQQVVRFTNHPLSLALHLMLRGTKIALPVLLLSGQVAQVMAEPIASSHNDVINEQVEKSTLPTITVIANDDKSTSYITKKIAIGKTPQSLKETPQSVSVVTRQRLDDQNISTIDNAMKYVTGITVARYDAAGNYNDFYARGYGSDTYQMDGTTLRTDSNGTYLDLSVFDRIEVLRGASGMFSGAGEPGVSINLVRKRALADFALTGKVSAGSWENYRGETDITGKLTQDGALRGRLVTAVQDYDTFMNGIDGNKKLIYSTLEYDIQDNTTLSLGATYQDINTVLSRGLPYGPDGKLLNISRKTSFVQDWNKQDLTNTELFAELEHHLNNDGLMKATVRQSIRDNHAKYSDPSQPDANGDMSKFSALAFKRQDKDLSADIFFNTPFLFAGQTHNFLIGADYLKGHSKTNYSSWGTPLTGTINIYHDNQHQFAEPDFDYDTNVSKDEIENYGIYSQLRIKPFEHWTLVGGGRVSWWKSISTTLRDNGVDSTNPAAKYDAKAEFTPYAAVLFDLNPNLSFYTSYSEIFKPQNNFTYDPVTGGKGKQIDPRTGTQIEAGMKAAFFDERLNLSSAIYQIEDKNRAITDLSAPEGYSVASGKARSRGFEIEANGQITDNWQITTGYSFNQNKYLEEPGLEGQPVSTFTPKHTFNLWTTYKLPASLVEGVNVGLGVRAVSSYYDGSGAERVQQNGYTLASASLGYQINPRYKFAINVDNLFDKKYYEKVNYWIRQNMYGSPRSVTASLSFKY
ncbi:TonB-dependent siderophore receptor [Acinetobacter guillouiae]|uniref:TonB-dependent siderophore receptor n=1 Tax=Acinetobacter guillouiae TaxID=106649 RepID=UPI00125EC3A8|nr:TonB-dependent siderophore receptor [Acinetobacter guillouiae]